MLPTTWVDDPITVIVPSAVLLACVEPSVPVALLAPWGFEASWVVDGDGGGADGSGAVCVFCCDEGGAAEDVA
jgi:hypothetical protein